MGYTMDADYTAHAYSANTSGAMTELDSLGQRGEMQAMAVNDSGAVLSCLYDYNWDDYAAIFTYAFVQANGQTCSLNSVDEVVDLAPGLRRKILGANDINNLGQIVGMSGLYAVELGDWGIPLGCVGGDPIMNYDPVRALLYTPGSAPIELGVLPGYGSISEAMAVNDLGQVVGYSEFENCPLGDASAAFLYSDGRMYDLNMLVDASAQGSMLTEAYGINNKGQIIAYGSRRKGNEWLYGTFLLTPVPEPSSLVVLFSGLTAAASVALRRKNRR